MKKINIRVIPRSSQNSIVKIDETHYKVKLTTAPVDGAANKALIAFLAKEWSLKKYQIEIIKGETSRDKIIGVIA